MEVDTDVSLTVVSGTTLAEIWGPNQVPPLQPTTVWRCTYMALRLRWLEQ